MKQKRNSPSRMNRSGVHPYIVRLAAGRADTSADNGSSSPPGERRDEEVDAGGTARVAVSPRLSQCSRLLVGEDAELALVEMQ